MSTTVTEPIQLGIAEPIRNDPALMEAVKSATEYFEESIESHHLYPAERKLMWYSDSPAKNHIGLHVRERDDYGDRQSSRMTDREHLLDPVSRNVFIIDVFLDILKQRGGQVSDKIERGIEELEREELTRGVSLSN